MENANKAEVDTERKGIGTQVTRVGILEKLIKSGLSERKDDKKVKYFTATHKGTALITTTRMGAIHIDDCRVGRKAETCGAGGADALFPSERESVGKCPRCGGAVTENKKGFCCSNMVFRFAIWKENRFFTTKKKTVTKAIVTGLLKKGKYHSQAAIPKRQAKPMIA